MDALHRLAKLPTEQADAIDRMQMERALDVATWLDIHRPELRLS